MTLEELKAELANDVTMAPHFEQIRTAASKGGPYVSFYDSDIDDTATPDDSLTIMQVNYLREKGYTVTYEKYHSKPWYVSGWV